MCWVGVFPQLWLLLGDSPFHCVYSCLLCSQQIRQEKSASNTCSRARVSRIGWHFLCNPSPMTSENSVALLFLFFCVFVLFWSLLFLKDLVSFLLIWGAQLCPYNHFAFLTHSSLIYLFIWLFPHSTHANFWGPWVTGWFSFSFTIHRLAAKSFLQTKDMGFRDTPAKDKKDVLKVSIDCGVISSQTAFIAVNKSLNKPVQGPLARRDVPRPILLGAASMIPRFYGGGEFYPIPRFYGGGGLHSNSCKIKGPGFLNTSFEAKACDSEFFPLSLHT